MEKNDKRHIYQDREERSVREEAKRSGRPRKIQQLGNTYMCEGEIAAPSEDVFFHETPQGPGMAMTEMGRRGGCYAKGKAGWTIIHAGGQSGQEGRETECLISSSPPLLFPH